MAKKYNIEVTYITGDSFSSSECYKCIDTIGWENIDIVNKNIDRIKEHYKWASNLEHNNKSKLAKPDWVEDGDDFEMRYNIKLFADNGNEYKISCFWIGYFEYLLSLTITYAGKDMVTYKVD